LHILVCCCFVSGRYISLGVLLYYWPLGRTICSVVTCEGGITTLSCNPLPSQNPRSPGTSPLGFTTLIRKNHPIVVTLGGIGSCYARLTLQPLAFYPCYKLHDNRTKRKIEHDCRLRYVLYYIPYSISSLLYSCLHFDYEGYYPWYGSPHHLDHYPWYGSPNFLG
jgi:hypothetical protein